MSTKMTTGKCRFSFCNVFEAKAPQGGGDAKYSVTLLIPKSDSATIQKLNACMKEAADNYRAKNGSASLPAKPQTTLHDGDLPKASGEEYGPECKGHYVITVSSKTQPVIVDRNRQDIIDQTEVYSGCYGRASIVFYAYNMNGKKGISAQLLGVQKLADGEAFGTRGSASDFDDGFDDDDDDLLS